MWEVTAALSVAGGLKSRSLKKKAARAARRDAEAQAKQLRKQKFDVALYATQQHEQRMEQFRELANYNIAMNAFMGRTGRSIQALRKEEQRKYGRDVDRLRFQESREKEKLEEQAKATIARGRATAATYKAQARATLFDTAFKAASLFPDS